MQSQVQQILLVGGNDAFEFKNTVPPTARKGKDSSTHKLEVHEFGLCVVLVGQQWVNREFALQGRSKKPTHRGTGINVQQKGLDFVIQVVDTQVGLGYWPTTNCEGWKVAAHRRGSVRCCGCLRIPLVAHGTMKQNEMFLYFSLATNLVLQFLFDRIVHVTFCSVLALLNVMQTCVRSEVLLQALSG